MRSRDVDVSILCFSGGVVFFFGLPTTLNNTPPLSLVGVEINLFEV